MTVCNVHACVCAGQCKQTGHIFDKAETPVSLLAQTTCGANESDGDCGGVCGGDECDNDGRGDSDDSDDDEYGGDDDSEADECGGGANSIDDDSKLL